MVSIVSNTLTLDDKKQKIADHLSDVKYVTEKAAQEFFEAIFNGLASANMELPKDLKKIVWKDFKKEVLPALREAFIKSYCEEILCHLTEDEINKTYDECKIYSQYEGGYISDMQLHLKILSTYTALRAETTDRKIQEKILEEGEKYPKYIVASVEKNISASLAKKLLNATKAL